MFCLVRTGSRSQEAGRHHVPALRPRVAGGHGPAHGADQREPRRSARRSSIGVRVPVRNVVGEIHGGWTVAKALLAHERTQHGDVFLAGGDGAELRSAGARQGALRRVGRARRRRRAARRPGAERHGPSRLRPRAGAPPRPAPGRPGARRRGELAAQGVLVGAEPAPARAGAARPRAQTPSAGTGRASMPLDLASDPRLAALARQHDRGRDHRDPARDPRQAGARPALTRANVSPRGRAGAGGSHAFRVEQHLRAAEEGDAPAAGLVGRPRRPTPGSCVRGAPARRVPRSRRRPRQCRGSWSSARRS
ncbi:MAG: hypothetical protein MZV70_45345 [Desulfobacterales bacterium]|nr:hypothetical protein [Desulfobacterales bacterium]